MLRDWLDVVDSVERAMRIESDGPCSDGLRAVLEQMDAVLARQGAQRIGAAGDDFDPERHEAIAVQPSAERSGSHDPGGGAVRVRARRSRDPACPGSGRPNA